MNTYCSEIDHDGYSGLWVIHELTEDSKGIEIKFNVNDSWSDKDTYLFGRTCVRAERDEYRGEECAEKPWKFTNTMMDILQEDIDNGCQNMDHVSQFLNDAKFITVLDSYERL